MKLYVMRHGPAEDQSTSGRDADRALTQPGRDRVRSVAKALLEEREGPDAILSSPLVRALQTAEIVAASVKLTEGANLLTRRELEPAGAAINLVAELRGRAAKRVMIVGHEPDLSSLVGELLGHVMPRPMTKAMVVGLQVASEGDLSARLRFILEPKSLVWEHDARGEA
jgi:phosphohistidine phosphatase